MIQHEHLALGLVAKNVTTANNNTPSVFLASSSQEAVKCYKQFLSKLVIWVRGILLLQCWLFEITEKKTAANKLLSTVQEMNVMT